MHDGQRYCEVRAELRWRIGAHEPAGTSRERQTEYADAVLRVCMTTLVFACCACGRVSFDPTRGIADAPGTLDTEDPCVADRVVLGPWSTPVRNNELSSPSTDEDPTPTADGLELFLVSSRNGGSQIFRATRATRADAWGSPQQVPELTGGGSGTIELSADALTMWFGSVGTGGAGTEDIWMTTRSDRAATWAQPVPVVELSSAFTDRGPSVFLGGLAMIFHSSRPGGLGGNDFYLSNRGSTSDVWSTPALLGPPNSTLSEQHAWVSACGLVLVFHTNRTGVTDLYEATRTSVDEPFGPETAITELNTPQTDKDLRMAPDRRVAYFSSNVSGNMDIYETSR